MTDNKYDDDYDVETIDDKEFQTPPPDQNKAQSKIEQTTPNTKA